MTKTTRYTIKYAYAGIWQYADFFERNGILTNPIFNPSYMKVHDIPSVENAKTIHEALEIIKSVAYCNNAEIYLIDGAPRSIKEHYRARAFTNKFDDELKEFINAKAIEYWEKYLEPIMKKNKWYIGLSHMGFSVLIHKDENGEWDNVRKDEDEFTFQYLCFMFVNKFDNDVKIQLKSEHSNYIHAFHSFSNHLFTDYLIDREMFIDLNLELSN